MPGLSQLKKFTQEMSAVGNEESVRSKRGEIYIPNTVPESIQDFDDTDDFLFGIPTGNTEKSGSESASSEELISIESIENTEGENGGNNEPSENTETSDDDEAIDFTDFDTETVDTDDFDIGDIDPDDYDNENFDTQDVNSDDLDVGDIGTDDFDSGDTGADDSENSQIQGNSEADSGTDSSEEESDFDLDLDLSDKEKSEGDDFNDLLSSMQNIPANPSGQSPEPDGSATGGTPDAGPDSSGTSDSTSDFEDSGEPAIDDFDAGIDESAFTTSTDGIGAGTDDALESGTNDFEAPAENEGPIDNSENKTDSDFDISSTDDSGDTGSDNLGFGDFSDESAFDDFGAGDVGDTATETVDDSELPMDNLDNPETGFDSDFGEQKDSPSTDEPLDAGATDSVPDISENLELPGDLDNSTSNVDLEPVMDAQDVEELEDLEDLDDGLEATESMESLDEFSTTDEKLNTPENFDSLDNMDLNIPGYSNDGSDFEYEEKTEGGDHNVSAVEDKSSGPRETFTEEEYAVFRRNLLKYPLNLRIELEKILSDEDFKDDVVLDLIERILKGATARNLSSHLSKYFDVHVDVPRDYERRTAEQYEAYKKSLEYQLKNRIIPICVISIFAIGVIFGLYKFSAKFIYRPLMAEKNYKAGYVLLKKEMYPQSEIKFEEAVSYKAKKKWFLTYAQGYRNKKQYDRARKMYERTLKTFNNDKQAGMEYAQMELFDLFNYSKAEQIVRRGILDYHINDSDAMLLLCDVYLEWATNKDPEKFELALTHLNDINQMYGPNNEYEKRYMRYYIRTDQLKNVLIYKNYFYTGNSKVDKKIVKSGILTAWDWIELSEYLLNKLYGEMPPNEEYLRSKIENVRQLLDRAIETGPKIPESSYNLARYFIETANSKNAEMLLKHSFKLFDSMDVRKPERIHKNIDAYRLLGEIYAEQQEFLVAEETYGKGIRLFEEEQRKTFLKPTKEIGHLYADIGDIDYFISGNTDVALYNYKKAVENMYETPSVNYRIGYIEYSNKNYEDALNAFLKAAEGKYDDSNVMFALGNVLELRNDDYSAQGYYDRLLEKLDLEKSKTEVLMPQISSKDGELVDLYMKTANNLGVVLHKLSNRTGNSNLNAESMVMFSESIRAWDALTRNPDTLIRLDGSNLASQNMKYVSHPYSDYEPSIYIGIPRVLVGDKILEQTFVK